MRLGTESVEAHIFVTRLGHSRSAWAEGYEHERMKLMHAVHQHVFERFRGVMAQAILYDRMRTVILRERDASMC